MTSLAEYGRRAQWGTIELMDGSCLAQDVLLCSNYYGPVLNLDKEPEAVKLVCMKEHGFILLSSHMGINIAAALYFHFGDQAIIKYGTSDRSYWNFRATGLVMWKAVEGN